MEPLSTIIGFIVVIVIIAIIIAFIVLYSWWVQANPPRRLNISLSRNPQYLCSSGSCGVGIVWSSEVQNLTIDSASLTLTAPDGTVTDISSQSSGSDTISTTVNSPFTQTGVYTLNLTVNAEDKTESESLPVHFFADQNFFIRDVWDTGFVGGALSADETVATHSTVIAQDPYTGSIPEIDGKSPSWATVCSKSMALVSVTYENGSIVPAGTHQRAVEVRVRRPGGPDIAAGTLQVGQTLTLPAQEVVDNGIEILSVMRSETSPPQSIQGARWALQHNLVCLP